MYDLRTCAKLGSGTMKHAYRVADDKVALISIFAYEPRSFLENEVRNLELIRDAGIRVPVVYGIEQVIRPNGIEGPALIEEFIQTGPQYSANVDQLKRIIEISKTTRMAISDFQFMVDLAGNVIVHDPYGVTLNAPDDVLGNCIHWAQTWVDNINYRKSIEASP